MKSLSPRPGTVPGTFHFQPEKEDHWCMLLENQLSTGLSLKPTLSWSLSLYPVRPVTAPYCKGDTRFHKTYSRLIPQWWIKWKIPDTVTRLSHLWQHVLGKFLQTCPSIFLCLRSKMIITFPCKIRKHLCMEIILQVMTTLCRYTPLPAVYQLKWICC